MTAPADSPLDVLRLEGMHFFSHHGDTAAEQEAGVHLDVDVEVRTDTAAAARSDRLADTMDYGRLVELCREIVEDRRYQLVETVAERLAETLLAENGAASVSVRVAKRPPLRVAVDRFSVTIERRRR